MGPDHSAESRGEKSIEPNEEPERHRSTTQTRTLPKVTSYEVLIVDYTSALASA